MPGLADFYKVCIMVNRIIQLAKQFGREEWKYGIYIIGRRFFSGCHDTSGDFGGFCCGFRNCGCSGG